MARKPKTATGTRGKTSRTSDAPLFMTDHDQRQESTGDLRSPEIVELVSDKLEELRKKLLDSTRRNPLIHIRFRPTLTSALRIVDELPDILRHKLTNGPGMRLKPLPALEDPLPDEMTDEFRDALFVARREDVNFLESMKKIDADSANAEDEMLKAERALKDRLRIACGLPPRHTKEDPSLADHARLHGIQPSYLLPRPDEVHDDGRHEDSDIQTLLLPERLSRSAKAILEKSRSFERETGINVLHAVFGLLEWKDPAELEPFVSPLLLLEIRIDRQQSPHGAEFFIRSVDRVSVNTNLNQKLQSEHGLELPEYEHGSVETFFEAVQKAQPPGWHWKVRREVAFGIFPSSKIAMYHDLDPKKRPVAENEIVARLLATTGSGDSTYAETYDTDDPNVAAQVPYLVMDADATQYSALVDVIRGDNLAIEGPPGSGKSQTIVNLIAAALATGKKVLFVAEKLAALDVVKSRLEAADLGNFVLPLQAGRRSTEMVYESIENRIKMSHGDNPTSQSHQKAHEKRRAILQGYLGALGEYLGSTGLTIHQVIGHAIATAKTRETLPLKIKRISIHNVDDMSKDDVEALVTEVNDFGDRLKQIVDMPAIWHESTTPITSHDTAEDHAATAAELAEALAGYDRDIRASELAIFITKNSFAMDMDAIGKLLTAAAREEGRIDADLLETLIDPGSRRAARDLCGQIQERQAIVARLGHRLRDPEGGNLVNRLKAAAEFATEHDSSLNPARHKTRLDSILVEIELAKAIITAARALPQRWTNSARTLADIHAETRRIADQPQEVRELRCADADGTVSDMSTKIEKRIAFLRDWLERIRQVLPLAGDDHDPDALRSAGKMIETSGFFGRMSSRFRAARNTYVDMLGGQSKADRGDMARCLRYYADWIGNRREFEADARFRKCFGKHFQGLNTDTGVIKQIVSFHAVCAEISDGDTALKQFLETADLDPVLVFAELENIPDETLSEVETRILSLEDDAERERRYISESEAHLELFRKRTDIPLSEIEEIMCKKEAEIALSEKIDASPAKEFLGRRFAGSTTRTDVLMVECDLAEAVAASEDVELALKVLRSGRVSGMAREIEGFAARRAKVEKRICSFVADLGLPSGLDTTTDLFHRVEDLKEASRDWHSLLDRIPLKRAEDSLRKQGLGDLIDWAIDEGDSLDPADLAPIVRALIARSMADLAYKKYPKSLQEHDGQSFDKIRAAIADKDRKHIAMSRKAIVNKLLSSANPPAGKNIGRKSNFTDMSLIYNEIHKKKGRIGIRDLTRRAGLALLELKPCWMMSPLAVAQYLDEGMQFDLVVIDEASQMTPENAVGAISRAKQAVVVGDTKQLPPTSFFQKVLDDSDTDEDLLVDSESILDMANVAFMPVRQLRWHYRSRHSSLIEFSNRWLYKRALTIFPSALENHRDLGVKKPVEVQGVYSGGRNEIEARAVIEAVVRHMTDRPDLSLGVCTMNSNQKDLLFDEFERERDRNPKVRAFVERWEEKNDALEEFFIKNIETIQGDERDVMIISTLYGPEIPGGKVHQRFGPINSATGHRRLNVLFTRAKRKIVTFTSMKPTDILVGDEKNLGVRMFRDWLEYCKTGHISDKAVPHGGTESPFEDFVMAQIERLGYEAVPQVGVSGYRIDLGVRHPDWPYGYILGVECDGATYHRSKSSRERDRLRQEVLEDLGWSLHRIWSTDWFRNPGKQIEILKKAMDSALAAAKIKEVCHSSEFDVATLSTHPAERASPEIAPETLFDTAREPADTDVNASRDLFQIAPKPSVGIGSKVKVENITDGGKKLAFILVEGENAPDSGKIGVHTPLGQALMESQVGDEVEYQVGSHIKEVRVLDIQ